MAARVMSRKAKRPLAYVGQGKLVSLPRLSDLIDGVAERLKFSNAGPAAERVG